MLAVVLAILAKPVVILKLGLRSISKRITGLIFLNIYTLPQHDLTHIMPRLKNVIFMETVLSFVLSRKIINIYNDIAQKYGNVTVKDLSLIFTCLLIK